MAMDTQPTSMLFSPPLPPLRLADHQPVVIGRHPSCEFPLGEANISRRHARVWLHDGRFVIEDLGSTNGTFVNGQRVESPRPLAPGDRIEISSCTLVFCQINGDVDGLGSAPGNEKTILFERPTSREAFHGELAEIPPFALLQVLEMGSKTGLLELEAENGRAQLWFVDGSPVHATGAKSMGFEAACELVSATQGRFRFAPGQPAPERTITATVTELLLEASRLQDEGER